jgi:hypothetical protein
MKQSTKFVVPVPNLYQKIKNKFKYSTKQKITWKPSQWQHFLRVYAQIDRDWRQNKNEFRMNLECLNFKSTKTPEYFSYIIIRSQL